MALFNAVDAVRLVYYPAPGLRGPVDPEENPEDLLRRAQAAFEALRNDEGFALLLRSAAAGSYDREWTAKVADEMQKRNPMRIWEVWQIRCSRPDAGMRDYLALARGRMFNARFHGPDVEPVLPETCPLFSKVHGEYWSAVQAMREAIVRSAVSETPEVTARLYEELATYHAFFGRYLECQMALENVAAFRAPRDRWHFSWEAGDSPIE